MSGVYTFWVPISKDKEYTESGRRFHHTAPYRKTGIQLVEWRAIRLLRLLSKDKTVTHIKWKEEDIHQWHLFHKYTILITISFEVKT